MASCSASISHHITSAVSYFPASASSDSPRPPHSLESKHERDTPLCETKPIEFGHAHARHSPSPSSHSRTANTTPSTRGLYPNTRQTRRSLRSGRVYRDDTTTWTPYECISDRNYTPRQRGSHLPRFDQLQQWLCGEVMPETVHIVRGDVEGEAEAMDVYRAQGVHPADGASELPSDLPGITNMSRVVGVCKNYKVAPWVRPNTRHLNPQLQSYPHQQQQHKHKGKESRQLPQTQPTQQSSSNHFTVGIMASSTLPEIRMCTQVPPVENTAPVPSDGAPEPLTAENRYKWQNGQTVNVRFVSGGSDFLRGRVRFWANTWLDFANIRFNWVNDGAAQVRVRFDDSGSSWSMVGTSCLTIAEPAETIGFGWLTDRSSEADISAIVLHEFGHVLGCIHEHQSPEAGIPWDRPRVYDWYAGIGWSRAKVDQNLFQLYARDMTQFSAYDRNSIMHYSIDEALTIGDYAVGWNTVLSQTDQDFMRQIYPRRAFLGDVLTFDTEEVRPENQPRVSQSKEVIFDPQPATPPNWAFGLTSLFSSKTTDIRVKTFVSNVRTDRFEINLGTWSDTILYSARCTYLYTDEASLFQVGHFDTSWVRTSDQPQAPAARQIQFPKAYASPPKVVVWLDHLDMDHNKNWRVKTYATDITATSFTMHIDTWADTRLFNASASWIAYPANQAGIYSGNFSTEEVRTLDPKPNTSSTANFGANVFTTPPRIRAALTSIDADCLRDLRVRLEVENVTSNNFKWNLNSWGDSRLFLASGSYIATAS